MRKAVAAGALLALTVGALAQSPEARVSPLDRLGWSMGQWTALTKALQPEAPSLPPNATLGPMGQAITLAGREDLVTPMPPRTVCEALREGGKPVDPIAHIAEAAEKAPITMIGEAHDQPLTRHFIGQVAEALRPRGYTSYAAETFNPDIAEKGPAIPLVSDGTYSDEPIYGRIIRRLRAQDYSLRPYEANLSAMDRSLTPLQMNAQREIEQATNVAAQMKRASGKVLVHAGQGHHSEYHRPERYKLMGTVFAETTGINPLTITLLFHESPEAGPVVCDPATFEGQPQNFDIRIGLPKLQFERGRPRWRLEAGDRFAEIPASLRRADQFAVYEARPQGERGDSTPMERLLLRPGETLPLLLPPGRYDLSVWTEKDGWSAVQPLVVAAN